MHVSVCVFCVRVCEFSQGDCSGNMIKIVELSVRTVAMGGLIAQTGLMNPTTVRLKAI